MPSISGQGGPKRVNKQHLPAEPVFSAAQRPAEMITERYDPSVDEHLDASLAELEQTPKSKPSPPSDPIDKAFTAIASQGIKTAPEAGELARAAFDRGSNLLLRAAKPQQIVLDFKDRQALEQYTDLLTQSASERSQEFADLSTLEKRGARIFFPVEGDPLLGFMPIDGHDSWLRTDAANASQLLARGKKLRVVEADGSLAEIGGRRALAQQAAQPAPDEALVKRAQQLDRLAGNGMMITATTESELSPVDYQALMKANIVGQLKVAVTETDRDSAPLKEQKLLQDLAKGRQAQVHRDGDWPHYPLALTGDQLDKLEQRRNDRDVETFRLENALQRIEQANGMVFTRFSGGELEGSLAKTNDAEVLALAFDGGKEAAILSPTGEMLACADSREFQIQAGRALGGPEGEKFARKFFAIEDAVGTLWARNSHGQVESIDPLKARRLLSKGQPLYTRSEKEGWHTVDILAFEKLAEMHATKKVEAPRVDPKTPKQNLLAIYHQPLHDPTGKFNYFDDALLKLQQVGSSEQTDMVVMHHDSVNKRNLRVDYVQKGSLELLEQKPPHQAMGEAKVFEDFVYQTIKDFPDREHIRLMVFGHGGAEHGTLYDHGPQGHTNIQIKDFAAAISKALDRVEKETGKRPVIDNLIMASCLMGNSSLVDELARRGDVKVLSASPEVLLNELLHTPTLEYLNDPATSGADARQFGEKLVDIHMQATGFSGGKEDLPHAMTYGSYDLDPKKNETFRQTLDNFFQACIDNPEEAVKVRAALQRCPNYQLHPSQGAGFGSIEKDVIQVAKTVAADRLIAKDIREAATRLAETAKDQVVAQKGRLSHSDREGVSMAFPMTPAQYPYWGEPPTDLLKNSKWRDFVRLMMNAPDRRTALEIAEENYARRLGYSNELAVEKVAPLDLEGAHADEVQSYLTSKQDDRSAGFVDGLKKVGAAVVGGVLGGIGGLVAGLALGARAGALGYSSMQTHKPDPEATEKALSNIEGRPGPRRPYMPEEPITSIAQARKELSDVSKPLGLVPMELVGTRVHRALRPYLGGVLSGLVAAPIGAVAGAGLGALSGATLMGLESLQPIPPKPQEKNPS